MSQQPVDTNVSSHKLITLIKCAYWVALLIIAAMAMASFMFLQQMMASQQNDQALLSLTGSQKALSQRVVFLANAATAAPREEKPALLYRLREATADFERNYDTLLERTGADSTSASVRDERSIDNVLFAKPHHLDYFSAGLAANGWRILAALESEIGAADGYLAARKPPCSTKRWRARRSTVTRPWANA